jgi:small GTP-binding protein
MEDDKAIKVILVGESGVGKTNLIRVTTGDKFEENPGSTISSSYCESQITVGKKKYMYYLWDTAGQEKFRSLNQLFIKDSKIILIIFSINEKASFEHVDFWNNYVKDILGKGGYIIALIGNKSDLYEEEDVVSEKEIEKKAEELGIKYKVASARADPKGFKTFLEGLLEEYIIKYHPDEYIDQTSFQIKPTKNKRKNSNNDNKNNNKKCC